MTARMANPTQRALRKRSTAPVPKRAKPASAKADPLVSRALYTDTSNLSAEEMAEVISPDKPLTEKQKLFVKNWAEGDSIPSAARRAGYNDSASVAYRLVKMPNVLALKHKYEAKYEADSQMDRKQVMEGFKEAIEMAKLMADPTAMISGWREIGRMCGYYAPVETKLKIDVTGNVTMTRLTQMSDDELLKMIEQGAQNPETPLLTDENQEPQPD